MLPSSDQRLRAYARVLLRHRIVIAAVTMLVLVVGVTPSLLADPTYASSASVRVRSDDTRSPFSEERANVQTQSRELLTHIEVIESRSMRARVLERLGPEAEAFESITATLVGFSEVLEIRVTAATPTAAAEAANVYAEVFVEERQRQAVEALTTQAAELRRRSEEASEQIATIDQQLADPATGPSTSEQLRVNRSSLITQSLEFSRRADELEVEAALRVGSTEIVNRARPETAPVSPNPLRTGVTAGILGVLAGVAIAVVLDIVQDRTSSAEELSYVDPSIPVLSSVPHMNDPAQDPRRADEQVREAFRHLRTAIDFRSLDRPVRSVLVTSAVRAEGKTTTAVNLALACAQSGSRVVLIDADLRRPSIHRSFGLPNDRGLSCVLSGEAGFTDAVSYVEDTLAVVTAGPASEAANELLDRPTFAKIIRAAAAQSDMVVVDVPPALPVADPLVAARSVDGVLVVSRIGVVRRRELRSLLRRLREASIPVIGFVANDVASSEQYESYSAQVGN